MNSFRPCNRQSVLKLLLEN